MLKKICLFIILIFIGFLLYFSFTSDILKTVNSGKDIDVLFIYEDFSDETNVETKFFAAKYNSYDKYIKTVFVDENITVFQKTKKSKTLKEMFVEVEKDKRIVFIKNETEKLFDGKLNFDFYILLDKKSLETVVEIFSKSKDLKNNTALLNKSLNRDVDVYDGMVCRIKLLNYVYYNSQRIVLINLLKCLYDKKLVVQTNFKTKEFLLLYSKIFNGEKIIRFADVPTVYKRNRIELDSDGMQKIIKFFEETEHKDEKKDLKIEVLNSTKKSRLAIKAANKLRENSFDVVDWGSSSKKYEFTMIFDLVNNYEKIKNIKNILNCGEIIFRPQERPLTDVSVMLGQDCNIYDKLDREADD